MNFIFGVCKIVSISIQKIFFGQNTNTNRNTNDYPKALIKAYRIRNLSIDVAIATT
jgi:hypothetical protein